MDSEERYIKRLTRLAEIVANTHFIRIKGLERDDLIQVAVLKGYDLTIKGGFDKKKGSLRNYVYTGMRNEMTNFLYHMKKDIVVEEILGEVGTHIEQSVSIMYSDLVIVLEPFSCYYEYFPAVAGYFKSRGIEVYGCEENCSCFYGDYSVFYAMVILAMHRMEAV